jgi:hypothetical protein
MSTDSTNNGKSKIYKNSERARVPVHKPYVPEYQLRGIEPEEYRNPTSAAYKIPKMSSGAVDNPRLPRPAVRQPYAEAVQSPIGRGRGLVPNVGNNLEHTWSSVDGEIIDDLPEELSGEQPMIDNNDFVSASALRLSDEPDIMEVQEEEILPPAELEKPSNKFLKANELQNALKDEYLSTVVQQLDDEDYIILVNGSPICSGSLDYIQEQTKSLVFGEHEIYHGNPVSVDDIVVLKRIKIKVGVFLA